MIEILDRRSWSPIRMVFTPSMWIQPEDGSTRRNSAVTKDDLPAPVRPTIPTWM